ncbi:hypothetical protein P8C59_000080 [Phyllachora maydis]|uniref:Uncharacterized protein n=1 Tax=Phyllachora maydis TaxID=1825666 RepID=A0AAD9HVC4_9PEZI|nr:hypothetical protein P8C59_000080 [Phyllachora maydis]
MASDRDSSSPAPVAISSDDRSRILDPKYYSSIGAALGPLFDRASMRVTMRADADWGRQYSWFVDGGHCNRPLATRMSRLPPGLISHPVTNHQPVRLRDLAIRRNCVIY